MFHNLKALKTCLITRRTVRKGQVGLRKYVHEVLDGFIIRFAPGRASTYLGGSVSGRPKPSCVELTDIG